MKRLKTSGPLYFRQLKDGVFDDLYVVTRPWWVYLGADLPEANVDGVVYTTDRKLHLLPGFQWNGASSFTIDPSRWLVVPAMHDGGYTLTSARRWPMSARAIIDRAFYDMLEQRQPKPPKDPSWWAAPFVWPWYGVRRGGAWARARVWYRAVDWFGKDAASPYSRQITNIEHSAR